MNGPDLLEPFRPNRIPTENIFRVRKRKKETKKQIKKEGKERKKSLKKDSR